MQRSQSTQCYAVELSSPVVKMNVGPAGVGGEGKEGAAQRDTNASAVLSHRAGREGKDTKGLTGTSADTRFRGQKGINRRSG